MKLYLLPKQHILKITKFVIVVTGKYNHKNYIVATIYLPL